jgi:hypothetical protein
LKRSGTSTSAAAALECSRHIRWGRRFQLNTALLKRVASQHSIKHYELNGNPFETRDRRTCHPDLPVPGRILMGCRPAVPMRIRCIEQTIDDCNGLHDCTNQQYRVRAGNW